MLRIMKKLFLIKVLLLFVVLKMQAQKENVLIVNFVGMQSDTGAVYLGLHNKEEEFLKKRFRDAKAIIKDGKAQARFEGIPDGFYSISSFHDVNDNEKLDMNFVGVPKEPYGISNDAIGFMGIPKYKDAKFEFVNYKEITITMQ